MIRRTAVALCFLVAISFFPVRSAEEQRKLTDESVRTMINAGLILLERGETEKAIEMYGLLTQGLAGKAAGRQLSEQYSPEAYTMLRIAWGIERGEPIADTVDENFEKDRKREETLKTEAAPAVPDSVAKIMQSRGAMYMANYLDDDANKIFDEILSTFARRSNTDVQGTVIKTWFLKLLMQNSPIQPADLSLEECVPALRKYNAAINSYLSAKNSELAETAAEALVAKAAIFRQYGSSNAVIRVYDVLAKIVADSDNPSIRKLAMPGALFKADATARHGRYKEAVAEYAKLMVDILGEKDENTAAGTQETARLHMAAAFVMMRDWANANRTLNGLFTDYSTSTASRELKTATYALIGRAMLAGLENQNDLAAILFNEATQVAETMNAPLATEGARLGRAMLEAKSGKGEDFFGNVTPDVIKPLKAVIETTAADSDGILRRRRALADKAAALEGMGDAAGAQQAYEQLIAEFHDNDDAEAQEAVALARQARLVNLAKIAPAEDVARIREEFIMQYRDFDSPAVRAAVADEMVRRVVDVAATGDHVAALTACDDLIERFTGVDEDEVRFSVARAMEAKHRLLMPTEPAEARKILEELIDRYGNDPYHKVKTMVQRAEKTLQEKTAAGNP